MYSDLFLQQQSQRSFPKVFVVAIVAFLGLAVGQVFIWYASVPTRASDVKLIQQTPVNISDTEASIYFETSGSVGATLLYGETPQSLSKPAYQAGDAYGKYQKSQFHLIPITGLRAETTYYYKLISDGKILTSGADDTFSLVTDGKRNATLTSRQPIYGKVVTPEGLGLGKAYVLVHLPSPQKQATYLTVSKDSGEWLVAMPTNLLATDPLSIDFIHPDYPRSHVQTVMEKSAPTPQTIVIGTDYTFSASSNNVLPAATHRTDTAEYAISLLYPMKDAIVPNMRPLFKGFGIPNTSVSVRVNSKPPYEGNTVINAQGAWVVEASRPFNPGSYSVSVSLTDNLGQNRIITRTFTIAKNGEQVLGESQVATPSGSLAPTRPISPSIAPTRPVVITATPMPTSVIYITATPYPTVFATATPSELEKSGGEIPVAWLLFGSLFLSAGVFLMRYYPSPAEH